MTEFWTAVLTLFGVGCFSWLAYRAGYKKGYTAGAKATWLKLYKTWLGKEKLL